MRSDSTLKVFKRICWITLIALLITFTVVLVLENRGPTVVGLWLIESPELPLVVWLVICFVFGLLVGSFAQFFLNRRRFKSASNNDDTPSSASD